MSGWIAIKRGITSHPVFKGHPARLMIWIWLVDNAAWKDTQHDIKGKIVDVPRGSVCASERHIAAEVGVGYQVVRTALKLFKNCAMINAKPTHGKNIITICNYDKYQSPEKPANAEPNAQLTQSQRSANAQKEHVNKETIDLPPSGGSEKAASRGHRIPPDWRLKKELGVWAMEQGLSEQEVRMEAANFRDYWIAATGKNAAKRDWDATWRNWVRNAVKRRPPRAQTDSFDFWAGGQGR